MNADIARRLINMAIVMLLMFAPYIVPAPDFLTEAGFKVLGVLFGCIYGWITLGIVGTSLLGTVMLGFAPGMTVQGVMQSGFGGETFMLVLFFAAFAGMLEQVNLGEWIANRVLGLKFSHRGPWSLSFALLLMAYCAAFVTSIMPGILISWGVLASICELCGFKRGDMWPKAMVVGIVLACCMGHSAWPIEVLSFTLLGIYASFDLPGINYLAFTTLNVSIGMAAMGAYVMAIKVFLRPDVANLAFACANSPEPARLSRDQKHVLAIAVVFFAVLFLPGAFPDAGGIIGLLKTIGNAGCAAIVLALAAVVRTRDGSALIDIASAIRDGVPWESLILIACAMPLSSVLTSDATGLMPLFQQAFGALFGGLNGQIAFSIAFVVLIAALTNVMGNITVGVVTMPILCSLGPAFGADVAMLTVVTCIACNAALLLPSGGPTAALLHGNRDWFDGPRDIYALSALAVAAFLIAAVAAMGTLGQILF